MDKKLSFNELIRNLIPTDFLAFLKENKLYFFSWCFRNKVRIEVAPISYEFEKNDYRGFVFDYYLFYEEKDNTEELSSNIEFGKYSADNYFKMVDLSNQLFKIIHTNKQQIRLLFENETLLLETVGKDNFIKKLPLDLDLHLPVKKFVTVKKVIQNEETVTYRAGKDNKFTSTRQILYDLELSDSQEFNECEKDVIERLREYLKRFNEFHSETDYGYCSGADSFSEEVNYLATISRKITVLISNENCFENSERLTKRIISHIDKECSKLEENGKPILIDDYLKIVKVLLFLITTKGDSEVIKERNFWNDLKPFYYYNWNPHITRDTDFFINNKSSILNEKSVENGVDSIVQFYNNHKELVEKLLSEKISNYSEKNIISFILNCNSELSFLYVPQIIRKLRCV